MAKSSLLVLNDSNAKKFCSNQTSLYVSKKVYKSFAFQTSIQSTTECIIRLLYLHITYKCKCVCLLQKKAISMSSYLFITITHYQSIQTFFSLSFANVYVCVYFGIANKEEKKKKKKKKVNKLKFKARRAGDNTTNGSTDCDLPILLYMHSNFGYVFKYILTVDMICIQCLLQLKKNTKKSMKLTIRLIYNAQHEFRPNFFR
ncbi:hypothetical protein RFI_29538 [Reticulomyxa filosa]|uniref:Uncharacterized protein n=1 Tax=Reticulomyxa filosa TaxID=46433 RepID=X6M310_RETFI|nr:hypothetical protein RFI_29538 [Reticulomyxa filosa]|eukprot:ETO07852.1 hypothetical protein RFI_29538 [Reticulomyxa filosa]